MEEVENLRVGLVGAGGIARPHIEGWKALNSEIGVDLVVFSEVGAHDLVQEAGFGQVCDSLEELLDHSQLVDIVTPTFVHAQIAEKAMEAGCDVICEKPLALTSQEARHVEAVAKSTDKRLYPAHVVRYFPQYARAHAAVTEGLIGDLAIARFERIGSFPDWSQWFADDTLSGGVVLDLMVHDLDMARWIGGKVRRVFATVKRLHDEEGNDQAVAQAVLEHASGTLSYVSGIWGPPGTEFRTTFQLSGNAGELHYSSADDATVRLEVSTTHGADGGGVNLPDLSTVESPYLTELRDFVDAIRKGSEARVNSTDGAIAVALAEAVSQSAATGHPVDVGDLEED